jgi:hypothetical protein
MSGVKEHTDSRDDSVIRLTVPISQNYKVQLFLNEIEVPTQSGECWYLKLTEPHRMINDGEALSGHFNYLRGGPDTQSIMD